MKKVKHRFPVYFISCFFLLSFYIPLSAQVSFSVSADTVYGTKPANYFVFYNYVEFENNTADTIPMRWKKLETICSNPGEPGNIWNIGIQDHVNFYNPANFLDSADFFIPTITGSTDKFLLHLFPNNLAGNLVVKFQFYPIDNPSDSVSVVFDYTVTEVVGVVDHFIENNFSVSPNPASHFFNISNHSVYNSSISVFSQEGKQVQSFYLNMDEMEKINCSTWSNGVYYLKIDCKGKSGLKQIVINNH
jgi:hypothetical protein